MFLVGPKFKNSLASKLASNFRPFDPGIILRFLTILFSSMHFSDIYVRIKLCLSDITGKQNIQKKGDHMKKLRTTIISCIILICLSVFAAPDMDMAGSPGSKSPGYPEPSADFILSDLPSPEPPLAADSLEADSSTADSSAPDIPYGSSFSIRFLDVGQADSALIQCDGHYMLIDGGNKEDSSLIYSVLKNNEITHLDLIVGTHAHEDHIGGLPGALNYATADVTLCPVTDYNSKAFSDFKKYAQENGGGITVPEVGDQYQLGSASVDILGVNSGDDTNDTSIVLKITYGETSFLFTGDAERAAEQVILDSGADLSATVLKVGHHGSETSTTYPFLRQVMPKYAVISVGAGNSYGHPAENTLSRLNDADVEVFRTDLLRDIICTSDGKTVTITTE